MLVSQGLQEAESLLDIVRNSERYKKELEILQASQDKASKALAELAIGKNVVKMSEEASKLKEEALAYFDEKVAEAEVIVAEAKAEAKTIRANLNAAKKKAQQVISSSEEAVIRLQEEQKKADEKISLAEMKHKKAEAEAVSAIKLREEWNLKVQDLKTRLKGII